MTPRKKVFPRVSLSVPRGDDSSNNSRVIQIDAIPPAIVEVKFPLETNGQDDRSFSFTPWYGVGIDSITHACQRQIERFLGTHEGSLSTSTVVNYCALGVRSFLDYMILRRAAFERDLHPEDVNRDAIDGFLIHLRDRGLSTVSQRTIYISIKPVLQALGRRGLLTVVARGDDATFPRNPFPGIHRKGRGETPLPRGQRLAFTAAVKTAVMPIFHPDAVLTSELLGYVLLVVSLHTGRNTVPLLELTTSCLRPHPKENTKFLVVYKRRGNRHSAVAVRAAPTLIESTPAVRPTVARLIERVVELTSPLRDAAPAHLNERLLLYRSRRRDARRGEITVLSKATLEEATRKLVQNARLTDSEGRPLRINCSRLRKTFVNRVNEILGEDLATTAIAAGNTPAVSGAYYLRPGESAERNWQFMGEVMAHELLTGTLGETAKTPTGRCTDNKNGQFAPKKDGASCMSFLDCLRCRNYVVTGEDLYKLFSFYWRVYMERNRMDRRRWEKMYSHIPRLIDRDVIPTGIRKMAFTQEQVDASRARARANPHPYWTVDGMMEAFG